MNSECNKYICINIKALHLPNKAYVTWKHCTEAPTLNVEFDALSKLNL